jgi:alkanesulfonate monooxygenase SsuD/methylene tetrahydromethanopterin reductase-like flavin-dependent oxidoreductase (luciferase family)
MARLARSAEPSFGVQPWLQGTDAPALEQFSRRAEQLGYDAIWSQDHLLSPHGAPDQPVYEALAVMGAWAMTTQRITIGCLVAANTFRNPVVLWKALVTTDHFAGGRVVLGLGGSWWQAEHKAAGLDFGTSPGERLRWLDESMALLRSLRAGTSHTSSGHTDFVDLRTFPGPVGTMPFVIGGSGEHRTLRIVARHADMWNMRGPEDVLAHKTLRLDELCLEIGRDPSEIIRSASVSLVIRDDPAAAERVWEDHMAANHNPRGGRLPGLARPDGVWFGPPDYIAGRLKTLVDLGFSDFVVDFPAPYDDETLSRLAQEVRPLLAEGS